MGAPPETDEGVAKDKAPPGLVFRHAAIKPPGHIIWQTKLSV